MPHDAVQRQALRQAALRHQPWRHAMGPRTAEGKAKSSANHRRRKCYQRMADQYLAAASPEELARLMVEVLGEMMRQEAAR